jgi:RNA recognition motif-containing protein
MHPRLFVLNLPNFFSESKVRDILKECGVTSIRFAHTVHGVLASIQTLTEDDLVKAETILSALKLPAPLGLVRGDTLMGQKLDETLRHITT